MGRTVLISLVLLSFGTAPALAKKKGPPWQEGKLTNAELKDTGAVVVPVAGILVGKTLKSWVYTIETQTTIYELVWRSPRPLNLTVNTSIKFALGKNNKALVLDQDGKKFRLSVLRKTAKGAAQ